MTTFSFFNKSKAIKPLLITTNNIRYSFKRTDRHNNLHKKKKATTGNAVIAFCVGVAGLEPTTSASRTQHSTN